MDNIINQEISLIESSYVIDTFILEFNYFKRTFGFEQEIVTEGVKDVLKTIKEKVKEAWKKAKEFIKTIIDKVIGFFKKLFGKSDKSNINTIDPATKKIIDKTKEMAKNKPIATGDWKNIIKMVTDNNASNGYYFDPNSMISYINNTKNKVDNQYKFFNEMKKFTNEMEKMEDECEQLMRVNSENPEKVEEINEKMDKLMQDVVLNMDNYVKSGTPEKIFNKDSLKDVRSINKIDNSTQLRDSNIFKAIYIYNESSEISFFKKCGDEPVYEKLEDIFENFEKDCRNLVAFLRELEKTVDESYKEFSHALEQMERNAEDIPPEKLSMMRKFVTAVNAMTKICPTASRQLITIISSCRNTLILASNHNIKVCKAVAMQCIKYYEKSGNVKALEDLKNAF